MEVTIPCCSVCVCLSFSLSLRLSKVEMQNTLHLAVLDTAQPGWAQAALRRDRVDALLLVLIAPLGTLVAFKEPFMLWVCRRSLFCS